MVVCVLSGWLCRWLIAAGKRPVPFRTRKLSLRRADGTALGRVWESRLLPTLIISCLGLLVVVSLFVRPRLLRGVLVVEPNQQAHLSYSAVCPWGGK